MRVVDHREVLNSISGGAPVVDVLPVREYRSFHIRGAIHLPLARLISKAGNVAGKGRPVVVYCRDSL